MKDMEILNSTKFPDNSKFELINLKKYNINYYLLDNIIHIHCFIKYIITMRYLQHPKRLVGVEGWGVGKKLYHRPYKIIAWFEIFGIKNEKKK